MNIDMSQVLGAKLCVVWDIVQIQVSEYFIAGLLGKCCAFETRRQRQHPLVQLYVSRFFSLIRSSDVVEGEVEPCELPEVAQIGDPRPGENQWPRWVSMGMEPKQKKNGC